MPANARSQAGRSLILVAGMTLLAGCLVVPTPEFSEIRSARLAFIEPGVTTRRELESELLSDDVFLARFTEPYAIYGERRTAPFQVIGEGTTSLMRDVDDYLVVEYDAERRVVQFERLRREGGCTEYGLCVRGGKNSVTDPLVVFAPTEADEEARKFASIRGACSVYLYVDGGSPCNDNGANISISHAGMPVSFETRARVDGYFHWLIPQVNGARAPVLTATHRTRGVMPKLVVLDTQQIDCKSGDVIVMALEIDRCFIGVPQATFAERLLSEAEPEISERRLILE